MKKIILLIAILALSHCFSSVDEYLQFGTHNQEDSANDRMLATNERDYIRIGAFYFLDGVDSGIANMVQQQLIPAALGYYQSALKVNRLQSNLQISSDQTQQCIGLNSPSELASGIPADVAVLVASYSSSVHPTTGLSGPCGVLTSNKRPVLGYIKFDFQDATFVGSNAMSYEKLLITTIHHMAHVLGFTPNLYNSYIDSNGNPLGNTLSTAQVNGMAINVLDLPLLTQKIRDHFQCQSLPGAYLENQDTSNAYLERRVFGSEMLTSMSTFDNPIISEISLAALEGTGWYTPDYTLAEPLFWGKGEGCDFLNTPCMSNKQASFSEFCSSLGAQGCDDTRQNVGFCGTPTGYTSTSSTLNSFFNYFGDGTTVLDSYADNCPYIVDQVSCKNSAVPSYIFLYGESYGASSMCFTGNLSLGTSSATVSNGGYCFSYNCQQSGSSFALTITVGSQSVNCPSGGGQVSVTGYSGLLTCPNPSDFCSNQGAKYCERGCSGRGSCVNGACVCNTGYFGDGCSNRTDSTPAEGTLAGLLLVKSLYPTETTTDAITQSSNRLAIILGSVFGVVGVIILAIIANMIRKARNRKRVSKNPDNHELSGKSNKKYKYSQSPQFAKEVRTEEHAERNNSADELSAF